MGGENKVERKTGTRKHVSSLDAVKRSRNYLSKNAFSRCERRKIDVEIGKDMNQKTL